jgi:hypothetical protein
METAEPLASRSHSDGLPSAGRAALIASQRRLATLLVWAASRWPELSLVGLGSLLRFEAVRRYPVELGYDFWEHQQTVQWWTEHFRMPPFLLSRGTYHPQPYYALCGLIRRLGGDFEAVQASSAVLGCARLAVMLLAAERYLEDRTARLVALALAAFIPVSVQMDAMMTQEPLNNLLSLLFAVCVMELCRAPDRARFRRGIILGCVTGLGLLTKVSNLALLAVLAVGALIELVQRRDLPPRQWLKRTYPWLVAAMVALGLSAPQYAYNRHVYGKAMLDGWYNRPTADTTRAAAHRQELLDRRTLGYVFGFSTSIVQFPYFPAGIEPTPRFWSALIATSYCDYFMYQFGPSIDAGGSRQFRGRQVGGRVTAWAKSSVASGIGIAAIVISAWLYAAFATLRRREVARPVVLAMPALGVCGALYFAIQYPYDFEGVVKGHYFHFVSPPLYALFGAGVAWFWNRRWLRPIGVAGALLIAPPAVYSCLCVLR